jgi:fibrillarin-like rRNA methylase
MKPKKKPVRVKWVAYLGATGGTSFSIMVGNAHVGWVDSEELAIQYAKRANAELSRLVAARDRRMK